jgi:hypothetical protein
MSETQLRELFSRQSGAAEPPLSPQFVARSLDAGRRRSHRRRATRAAVGGMAAFAALAIATTVIVGAPGGDPPAPTPGRDDVVAAQPTDAATLLGKISLAAAQRQIAIRDDQFVYEKRQFVTRFPTPIEGRTEVAGISESWTSVDGSRPGWSAFPDKLGRPFSMEKPIVSKPSWMDPTYKYLTTLPTDPDALLASLREIADAQPVKPNRDSDRDQIIFELIGHALNGTMAPPKLSAALYRVVAKLPGVTVIPDITDAAGRHGIGVVRGHKYGNTTQKWIFHKETYEFLGWIMTEKKSGADSTYAILTREVVDRVRQTP